MPSDPGIELASPLSPALVVDSLPLSYLGSLNLACWALSNINEIMYIFYIYFFIMVYLRRVNIVPRATQCLSVQSLSCV